MTHIDPSRWLALLDDALSPAEAEHLGTCAMCEQRWLHLTTPSVFAQLPRPAAPPALAAATVARFERAHAASTRARRVATWLALALLHAVVLLAWVAISAHGASLFARLAVATANGLALMGVAARLAAHFPLVTAVHLTGVGICALLLVVFVSQWMARSEWAPARPK